jgi:hypothetical protein
MLKLGPQNRSKYLIEVLREISEQVGQFRADVTVHRAINQGEVTELPNPITRKTGWRRSPATC